MDISKIKIFQLLHQERHDGKWKNIPEKEKEKSKIKENLAWHSPASTLIVLIFWTSFEKILRNYRNFLKITKICIKIVIFLLIFVKTFVNFSIIGSVHDLLREEPIDDSIHGEKSAYATVHAKQAEIVKSFRNMILKNSKHFISLGKGYMKIICSS